MIVFIQNGEYIVNETMTAEEFYESNLYKTKGCVLYHPPNEWPIPVPPLPVIIPTQVSMRQARLQLSVLGLYTAVNQAVQSMSEQAQISWEYASTVDRTDDLTQQMIALLGWTEAEADAYFLAASKL